MPIEYKKTRTFIQKGIDPYIQPIKKSFDIEFNRISAHAEAGNLRITNEIIPLENDIEQADIELTEDVDALESNLENRVSTFEAQFNQHLIALNPHQVKFKDVITTISSNDPNNTQGTNEDVWLSYLNPSYTWVVGTWAACSVKCGGGTRSRSVNCTRNDGTTVSDTFCINLGLTKPIASEVCNTAPCLYLRTVTNSNCGFTCGHQPMCTQRSINIDGTNGKYNFINSFTLANPGGSDYYWRFPFRVYDVFIWVKLAITSSVRPSITDIPMICADYAPKSWKPPRIQSFSAYYCELGFPNEQRNGSIWILARIPASYVGPDGNISCYIYTGEKKNYSGNMLYIHSDQHSGTNDYCSRVCLG